MFFIATLLPPVTIIIIVVVVVVGYNIVSVRIYELNNEGTNKKKK